jgi:hypothetical protein
MMSPSALVQEFHAYWRGLAAGQPPERNLFDPISVGPLMRGLHIVEMEAGTQRLRYRLVGTQSDDLSGMSLTGRYLDEFFAGRTEKGARFFDDIYRRIARTGVPEAGEYSWPTPAGVEMLIKFGVFPFRVDGEIRQFFYLEDFTDLYSPRRKDPWWVKPLEGG